jgi:cysteine-rich repeat protein
MGGVCKTAACGNGVLDTGEQCDFGSAHNGTGAGCSASCQFDCEKTPTDTCTTGVDPCTATPTACTAVMTGFGTGTGQTCQATTPIAACGACNGTEVCGKIPGNVCAPASCGDGCIESGEQCDPPGTSCSATCQNIICGDGVREGTEQCDDGNTQNLDGCDTQCHFEQIQRANSITMQFTATGCPCTKNALGTAIGPLAQSSISTPINNSVTAGSANILFQFLGITDLSGTNQASGLTLGALSGLQPTYTGGATGNKDLDWWYVMDPSTVMKDSSGHWITQSTPLPAKFTAGVLSATGDLNLALVLTGMTASQIHMSNAKLSASTAVPTLPTEAGATMMSPGHLAAEHLDPTLKSFPSMSNGSLCGNTSAASLANVLLTASITGTCTSYTTTDSILDLIVGGCFGALGVAATNPDQSDPAQPVWGAGPPYTFQETNHHVTSCKDKAGKATVTAADLATCEASAAYSSWFLFTSDRIIVHNM